MVVTDGESERGYRQLLFYGTSGKYVRRIEHPNVGGVSSRSKNGAPSREGCVVNVQMTKKGKQHWSAPPSTTT